VDQVTVETKPAITGEGLCSGGDSGEIRWHAKHAGGWWPDRSY